MTHKWKGVFEENPVRVSFCYLKSEHALTWNRTWVNIKINLNYFETSISNCTLNTKTCLWKPIRKYFAGLFAVCFEIPKKTNIKFEWNVESLSVKPGGTLTNPWGYLMYHQGLLKASQMINFAVDSNLSLFLINGLPEGERLWSDCHCHTIIMVKGKSKVFSVQAMKAYRWSTCVVPLILEKAPDVAK